MYTVYTVWILITCILKETCTCIYNGYGYCLFQLFQNASLAKRASKDILKDLMHRLVTMLLDNRLMKLDDGPQIVRSVNVLVVKIVEKSDQTNALW